MGLVDYPDSDESDTQQVAPPKSTSAPAGKPKTAAFEKAESGKIRLNLPEVRPVQNDGSGEPPPKRAKTGGAFAGLSARLPAPKNANKPNQGSSNNALGGGAPRGNGTRLGAGVNLRTGAAPGFDRTYRPEPTAPTSATQAPSSHETAPTIAKSEKPQEEVKLIGKPMMFKPLSVSKRSQNTKSKKPLVPTEAGIAAAALAARRAEVATGQTSTPAKGVEKTKVPLFGSMEGSEEIKESSFKSSGNGEYKPLLDEDEEEEHTKDDIGLDLSADTSHLNPTSQAQPDNLQTIASQLNLSASERRRLFGRDGQPDAVKIQQFNLAREYQLNNELRETQAAAPQQNAVRSIAPGKHSLQQLVNAATSQKDALEDSFAQGRKNKTDAGSKYGW